MEKTLIQRSGTTLFTINFDFTSSDQQEPFCAFTCAPQGEVIMEPNENIVLFASQTDAVPGSVTKYTTGSGCNFAFSDQNVQYELEMIHRNYGIRNVPGKAPVKSIPRGTSLAELLNIK